MERAAELDRRVTYRPNFAEVARALREIDLDLDPEDVLLDRRAPVDRLIHLGRQSAIGGGP